MSILLWAGAFLTIGGEWFAMWQSEKWNGTEAAMRNFMVSGIALAIVLLVANGEGRPIDSEVYELRRSRLLRRWVNKDKK
jgi:hypothetical protein